MDFRAKDIKRWHTEDPPKGRGWRDIGYHYVVPRDGNIESGRPVQEIGAHCRGHNDDSIGVCLVGRHLYNYDQLVALRHLLNDLMIFHGLDVTDIHAHYQFAEGLKTCPNINIGLIRVLTIIDLETLEPLLREGSGEDYFHG